jgi:hypothetical protein
MGKTKKRATKKSPPPGPVQNPKLAQQRRAALRTHYAAKYRAG